MKLVVLAAVCVAAAGLVPQASQTAVAGQCGLPDSTTLWFDYAEGSVPFRNQVFGHPGVIAATSGVPGPAALRKLGAQTVYWEMHLDRLAGTTTAPADPSTIQAAADKLYDKAVATTGCPTPLIGINELNGSGLTTPWAPANAPVPRKRTRAPASTGRPRRPAVPAPVVGCLHRRRGSRLVAPGGTGLRSRPRGLFQRTHALQAGSGAGQPSHASGFPRRYLQPDLDWDPRAAAGAGNRLPVRNRLRGPGGSPADECLARLRQASDTRRQAGGVGARDRVRVVLGVGDVLGSGRRQGQAGRRLRLPVGA